MTGFIFALIATLLAGLGARDQMLVAALSARTGPRPAVLLLALASALLTTALAAAASRAMPAAMPGSARLLLAALAAGLAGAELLFARAPKPPAEPTNSLGAFAIVILAQQLTDAVRFIVLAITLETRAPISAGLGGAVGSIAILTLGWTLGPEMFRPELARLRRTLGAILLLPALWAGAHALGRV